MIVEKIELKKINKNIKTEATLTSYVPTYSFDTPEVVKRKPVLVIPGGGYEFVSEAEGEPVALFFAKEGYAPFVLKYSLGDFHDENMPQNEAFAAIAYIKENAEKYHLDLSNFSIIGFSAGGHLAGTVAMQHTSEEMAKCIGKDVSLLKVDNLIMCYPVTSMYTHLTHGSTRAHRTLNNPVLEDKFTIYNHISKDFPRTFIWTTADDDIVNANHSVILAEELIKNNVECELHVFRHGPHGLNIVLDENHRKCRMWLNCCIEFINSKV